MIRIGIISPSDIALRRFLPALSKLKEIKFIGVAISSGNEWTGSDFNITREQEKAKPFIDSFGGKIFMGYENLITSDEIDAVYIPLPPAIHYQWAKLSLMYGKHVLIEKPATTSLTESLELLSLAKQNELAIHENYMFVFHNQIRQINEIIANGEIGEVRLYRISFGFPQRPINDFRYNKSLGGGAIMDCGGYTLKYASLLLGDTAKLVYAQANDVDGFEVDMYGSGALINKSGITAQVAFGMDNSYRCELEVWGSKGIIYTNRVLTAPVGYVPELTITKANGNEIRQLADDDTFMKSIQYFTDCINHVRERKVNYLALMRQAHLLEQFISLTKKQK